MALTGAGRNTEGAFRHPLYFLSRLSQRTPLRVKLITALLALVALALAVISFTSNAVFQHYLLNQADNQLSGLLTSAEQQLGRATGTVQPNSSNGPGSGVALAPGYIAELLDQNGGAIGNFGNAQRVNSAPAVPASSSWLSAHIGKPLTVSAKDGTDWRIIMTSVPGIPIQNRITGQTQQETVILVVGEQIGNIDRPIGYLSWLDLIVSLIIMIGLAVVSVAVVRTNLRPLDDIEHTAEDIAAGHLERRVPDRDPRTEVGRLGRSINTMLTQIESAFHAREQSEEAAVQSEERMRRFIADAGHELRTPLTAIKGFAEYYRQRGGIALPEAGNRGSLSSGDLNRIMQRVEGEASRMGVLVEDLQLLARLDQHQPVDLLVLAADAVQDTRMIAPDRPVLLTVEPGKAFLISGDEVRLRQVIGNLMNNALKYTPDGSPIDVRLRSGFVPGQAPFPGAPAPSVPAAIVEVADRGPGLTAEQAGRVFERFYRADEHRNRKSGGSGLGLAIVSALIEAHGGLVEVDTAPGQGATFRIMLPLSYDPADGGDEDDEDDDFAEEMDGDAPGDLGTAGDTDSVSFGWPNR